jgi:hypothetical protein
MKKIILVLVFSLIASVGYADLNTGCTKSLNTKYSFQAFAYHGVSFKGVAASEFNNTCIKGTSFYQEWVKGDVDVVKDIFPDGMTGVEFIHCNLDNIEVPVGNTADITNATKKIQVQNDLEDWILDVSLKAVEPIDKARFIADGKSIDPKDIPLVEVSK